MKFLQFQVARTGVDVETLEIRRVLLSQLTAKHEKLQQYLRRAENMLVRAPIDGVVVDLCNNVHLGRLLPSSLGLFMI
ncbi:MAG: hypothetical protein COC23_04820 [Hyphomicrobiales bacterium]|nr:MAG: hypothetical protein COC23_04820 [Hyphomicrobiales bacterium]